MLEVSKRGLMALGQAVSIPLHPQTTKKIPTASCGLVDVWLMSLVSFGVLFPPAKKVCVIVKLATAWILARVMLSVHSDRPC